MQNYLRRLQAIYRTYPTQKIDSMILPRSYLDFRVIMKLCVLNSSGTTFVGENYGYYFSISAGYWKNGNAAGVPAGTVVLNQWTEVDFRVIATDLVTPDCTILMGINGANPVSRTYLARFGNGNTGTFYLYNINNYSASGFNAYLGEQKIYGDGVLLGDFIPVLDLNGVPCYHDLITGTNRYPDAGVFSALENPASPCKSFIPSRLYPLSMRANF